MADIQPNRKTSAEDDAGDLQDTDLMRLVQGLGTDDSPWVSVKSTLAKLKAYFAPTGAGSGIVQSIVAGDNITVDNTDPANPIVSSTGGGGGGASPFGGLGVISWYSAYDRFTSAGSPVGLMTSPFGEYGYCLGTPSGLADTYSTTGESGNGTPPYHTYQMNIGIPFNKNTIALVVRMGPLTNGYLSVPICGGGASFEIRLECDTVGYATRLISAVTANLGDDTAYARMTPGGLYLIVATREASTGAWAIRRNGVQTASGTATTSTFPVTNFIGIGADTSGNNHGFREVVFFDHVLSPTDLTTVETYLMTKHGI